MIHDAYSDVRHLVSSEPETRIPPMSGRRLFLYFIISVSIYKLMFAPIYGTSFLVLRYSLLLFSFK